MPSVEEIAAMLLKAMVLLLIAAFAGLFFIKGPDGSPLLSLSDLKPEVPDLPAAPAEPATVYRWQDENGVWQFSNQPEDAPEGAEVMELKGDINLIPAVDTTTTSRPSGSPAAGVTALAPVLSTGAQTEELMQAVDQLKETAEARKEQLDQLSKPGG